MLIDENARVDKVKNRIYLYFRGFMTIERAKELKETYRKAITECKPGFTTVTFAEEYKPGSPEVQDIVEEMTKMAEKAGIRKVARVVGETPLGAMQIDRLAKKNTIYPSRHFRTLEEAEEYLDSDQDEFSEPMKELTRVDKEKNRIYIKFQGKLDLKKALELKESYRKAIAECKPGFTTLTYAMGYKPATPEVQDIVADMTKMAEDAGIKKVARVVGESPLGGMQINRLAKMKTSYPSRHFRTEAEAEAYLDSDVD